MNGWNIQKLVRHLPRFARPPGLVFWAEKGVWLFCEYVITPDLAEQLFVAKMMEELPAGFLAGPCEGRAGGVMCVIDTANTEEQTEYVAGTLFKALTIAWRHIMREDVFWTHHAGQIREEIKRCREEMFAIR